MIEVFVAAIPLLLLLGSLLLGFYPGCETVVRLAERIEGRASCRHPALAPARRPRPPRSHAPRGGLLIAFGHAQRPPPLAV
ncbi:MAG TPA: hypothetical protein VHQ43_03625 [Solirubrobacterales bacterium]|jgi:hypothetical protein|nr:hypothetical protein [Solirubrobacterales bacterium]